MNSGVKSPRESYPSIPTQSCGRLLPLPDGHLLITCGDGHKVIEIDATEKVVRELNETELPGNPLRLMAGCQRLTNGNMAFVNYLAHGHAGQRPSVIEVTRDKRVVWFLDDRKKFKVVSKCNCSTFPAM